MPVAVCVFLLFIVAVECEPFDNIPITQAKARSCNVGGVEATQCTFDQMDSNERTGPGVACRVNECAENYVLADLSSIYVCTQDETSLAAEGVWMSFTEEPLVCNEGAYQFDRYFLLFVLLSNVTQYAHSRKR